MLPRCKEMDISADYPLLTKGSQQQLIDFIFQLRRRKQTSFAIATDTLALLKRILGSCRWQHTQQCIDYIRGVGHLLMDARPMELAIGNMVRRVLFIIREEFLTKLNEEPEPGAGAGAAAARGGGRVRRESSASYAMQP